MLNKEKQLAEKFLYDMQLSRKFEEEVQRYFALGMIHGTTHLSIGEEGTSAGTCAAMSAQDEMFVTHRGHGQAVCRGIDINKMMAEIFAKSTGCCKGKGGSMHIVDRNVGIVGSNGVLGASFGIACGSALAIKKRAQNDKVIVLFFGEGCTNEGGFHEGMNLASIWNLPILFICINNMYGMSTHISKVMKDIDIKKRAVPYAIPSTEVFGNDVFATYETVKAARDYVIAGNGPMLVIEHTYRISGHSKSDKNLYRTEAEIKSWQEKCPIKLLKQRMLSEKISTQEKIDEIETMAKQSIDKAVRFALDSDYPLLKDVLSDVYA